MTAARAGLATSGAVAETGARTARALVSAHQVTGVARAHEAALRVDARLAARAFLTLVPVHARAVVAGVQLVAAVAEAFCDRVSRVGVVGDAAAVVAGCIAAHGGGGGGGVGCCAGTWPPVQEGKIGDIN